MPPLHEILPASLFDKWVRLRPESRPLCLKINPFQRSARWNYVYFFPYFFLRFITPTSPFIPPLPISPPPRGGRFLSPTNPVPPSRFFSPPLFCCPSLKPAALFFSIPYYTVAFSGLVRANRSEDPTVCTFRNISFFLLSVTVPGLSLSQVWSPPATTDSSPPR